MLARAGCCYATPLKGHQGVTQADTLSLTIFNMVVDVIIHQWVTLVAGEEAVPEIFERSVQWLAAFFYADDRLLILTIPSRLQAALDVLMGLFDRVGLHTNVDKMVGMVCQTCYIVSGHLEASYTWQMTDVGSSFQELHQERV